MGARCVDIIYIVTIKFEGNFCDTCIPAVRLMIHARNGDFFINRGCLWIIPRPMWKVAGHRFSIDDFGR